MKQLRTWFAAVLITVCSTWVLTPAANADERTDARREFRQGMQMVADGQYDEGIKHLERAYDILPHPNVLYNIALAHTYAGRADAAVYYFERYKETAPSADAVEVDAMIARLKTAQAAAEGRAATPEAPTSAEQSRDDLAMVEQAAAELRRVGEAQNDESLKKRADDLEAAARKLREKQGATAQAPTDKPTTPTPGGELPTGPGGELPKRPPELDAVKGAQGDTYEEQVVSASRLAQSPLDAPNATAIITAQDIRLTGLNNLVDLLRRVAGVEVNSVTPNTAEINIRGLNRRTSNKLLLLIDGRSIRLDVLGANWWDFLPVSIEDVERIEIVKGPASALYGADAFSGIINIVTRAPGESGNFVQGGLGNHDGGRAVASFNGKNGDLAYHYGFGYDQEDVSRLQLSPDRVDTENLTDTPEVASRKMWANAELRYPLAKKSLVTVGGSVVQGDQIVQGLGRLQQTTVDDITQSQLYGSVTTPVGIRLATWWNRFDMNAGLSTQTPGAVDIPTDCTFDVVDVDLSYSDKFDLGVPQSITIGGGYRYKRGVDINWLDADHKQHHFGAYLQDVIDITKALTIQIGARVDRHPLLEDLQFSPRGSIVYRLFENQSIRLSAGRAFRSPSYLESYLEIPVGTPVRGVLAYGVGRTDLDPESITSFELGYQNQASEFFAFEVNAYYNLVKDFIYLSDFDRFTLGDFANDAGSSDLSRYDDTWDAFPVSTLSVQNQRATFQQIGGEAGVRFYPVTGLDVYLNYAAHDTRPLDKKEVPGALADEQQTSLHKVNGGIQYRATFGLDTSVDVHWFSDQLWVEQVTDADRGVRDDKFKQPSFLMVNGRLGYRLFDDRFELGAYGTNLTFNKRRQHPFGQPMDTRFMGSAKIRF